MLKRLGGSQSFKKSFPFQVFCILNILKNLNLSSLDLDPDNGGVIL